MPVFKARKWKQCPILSLLQEPSEQCWTLWKRALNRKEKWCMETHVHLYSKDGMVGLDTTVRLYSIQCAQDWPPKNIKQYLSSVFLQIDLSLYDENGEWEVTDTSVRAYVWAARQYASDANLPTIAFTLHLKRKPTYFVLLILVPR